MQYDINNSDIGLEFGVHAGVLLEALVVNNALYIVLVVVELFDVATEVSTAHVLFIYG